MYVNNLFVVYFYKLYYYFIRFKKTLADCEEDDLDTKIVRPKAKLEKGRKRELVKNYLQENEDDILYFVETTTNKNI